MAAVTIAFLQLACGDGLWPDPLGKIRSQNHRADSSTDLDAGDDHAVTEPDDADVVDEASVRDAPSTDDASGMDAGSDGRADISLDGSVGDDRDASDDHDVRLDVADAADVEGTPLDTAFDRADDRLDVVDDGRRIDASDDVCTVGCSSDPFDLFVDAKAVPGGDGSRAKPFITITAALDRAASAGWRRIYVGPGLYDAALGERFPLLLRGITLEGAGRDKTEIVGGGLLDHATAGGTLPAKYTVTVLAGDERIATRISKISMRPAQPVPTLDYHGVFCDRGNATGETPSPGGQTRIDQVAMGPGYDAAIVASNAAWPAPTGCDLVLTGSTLTGGSKGVYAIGCTDDLGQTAPVVVEMGGGDPSSGNTVSWMQGSYEMGYGARIRSCVIRGLFRYNTFIDSKNGIDVSTSWRQSGSPNRFVIQHNVFRRLASSGFYLEGTEPFVDELSDNLFTEISSSANQGTLPATAVAVPAPRLGRVRRNRFIGNDAALFISAESNTLMSADLGTAADPGGNVFRCNSSTLATYSGGDVKVEGFTSPGPPGILRLAGNAWDHAPLQVNRDYVGDNGVDLVVTQMPDVLVDITNASLADVPCPADRVPGP